MTDFIEISEKEFYDILKQYPNHQVHTIGFRDPPLRFFWKEPAKDMEDRSFGKGSFLCIDMDYDIGTGKKKWVFYKKEEV